MPRVDRGRNESWELQKGWSVTQNDDGGASGTARFIANEGLTAPREGEPHPKYPAIKAVTIIITSLGSGKVAADVTYFGVWDTKFRVSYSSGSSQEAIQAHRRFSRFAGSYENPKNGAVWREIDGAEQSVNNGENAYEFLGFFPSKSGSTNDFTGVTDYIDVGGMVELTYLSSRAPSLGRLLSIGSIRGFSMPRGVKNALLVDIPYQQIGRNHYRVSEVYLLSGEKGWNREIYS